MLTKLKEMNDMTTLTCCVHENFLKTSLNNEDISNHNPVLKFTKICWTISWRNECFHVFKAKKGMAAL